MTNTAPVVENRDLLARAFRKVLDGQKDSLTRDESVALRRHEKSKDEKSRWEHYASIPQKHWKRMSGRQTKVINEQADRYGIPFGGPTVNLPEVVRAWHDFLAENKYKLARDDDPLMNGSGSPALERYREERASMARLDRLEREAELLQRDVVRQSLGKIAGVIRNAGEALQRQFGQSAADILNEALDDAELEIKTFFDGKEADAAE